VRLPELRDALAFPLLPRSIGRRGQWVAVPLEKHDIVVVTREQKGRTKTADAAADDQNLHEEGRRLAGRSRDG
jgi:hypothetical protein